MPYPRLVYLDKDTEERLISYIDSELTNHYAERGTYLDDLIRWQKDYWAKPSKERQTFPFVGAANIVIPLTAIAVEAVHARVMTMLFGLPEFVDTQSLHPEFDEVQAPLRRYLDKEFKNGMQIRAKLQDPLLEIIKFGTGNAKIGYEKVVKYALQEVSGQEVEVPVITKQGCTLDGVSESRFLMPFNSQDPQNSAWCGEEHSKTPYEVKQLCEAGFFYEEFYDELSQFITQSTVSQDRTRDFQNSQEQLENRQPVWPQFVDFTELSLAFNVDDNKEGKEHEIVVHYHRNMRRLMAVRYNNHFDLHRPYRTGRYFPVEYRRNGIGICKQNEQFIREITTQHRQRLDNATLANMRMFKISKLSGYGPNEEIFPGKLWFLDQMDHLEAFQAGEIYPSAYNNEQASLQYSQQRTGINETLLGMPQVGTPGTATSDLARIQEGNKKIDFTYQNIKEFVDALILDAACCIQQYGPRYIEFYDNPQGGQAVRQFFSMPERLIRDSMLISIKSSGQQSNKIIDRQNWTQVAALINQYYVALVQIAQMSGQQQLMQIILMNALTASTEAMKQILETFDVRNIDKIIVKVLDIAAQTANQNGSQSTGVTSNGNSTNQGIVSPFGGAGVAQLIPQLAGNGGAPTNRIQNY